MVNNLFVEHEKRVSVAIEKENRLNEIRITVTKKSFHYDRLQKVEFFMLNSEQYFWEVSLSGSIGRTTHTQVGFKLFWSIILFSPTLESKFSWSPLFGIFSYFLRVIVICSISVSFTMTTSDNDFVPDKTYLDSADDERPANQRYFAGVEG